MTQSKRRFVDHRVLF